MNLHLADILAARRAISGIAVRTPRKTISGFSTADHLKTIADAVAAFAARMVC